MSFHPKHLWMLAAAVACAVGLGLAFYLPTSPPATPAKNETVAIRTPAPANKLEPKATTPSRIFSDEDLEKLDKQPFMYSPAFAIGDKKYIREKKFILFEWSATNQESIEAYRKFVSPLVHQVLTNKSLPYVLVIRQRFEDKRDSLGPGGLILCAKNREQYALLAADYLLRGKEVSKLELLETKLGNTDLDKEVKGALKKAPHYVNVIIQTLFQEQGIDFSKCLSDGEYNFRILKAMGQDIGLSKVPGEEKFPYFSFPDGTTMRPSDQGLQKKIDQIAKTQLKP